MDRDGICRSLPTAAPKGLLSWALQQAEDELGGELTIFSRESVTIEPEIMQTMRPEDWARRERETLHKWGAVCCCTACNEEWTAGWAGKQNGVSAIRAAVGEDGSVYDGWVSPKDELAAPFAEGEEIYCPLCGSRTRLAHRGRLKAGRTYATQVGTLEVLPGGYTALLYWIVSRRVDEFGIWTSDIRPREAVVLDEKGKRWRFSRTGYSEYGESAKEEWEHRTFTDPEQLPFYCYGNGPARNTVGCWWWPYTPDLTGSTGEKTAVDEYIQKDGQHPAVYLSLWRENPTAENLVRQGWSRFISQRIGELTAMARAYRYRQLHAEVEGVAWEARRPHAMLNMTVEDWRKVKHRPWDMKQLDIWLEYSRTAERPMGAAAFAEYAAELSIGGVGLITGYEMDGYPDFELERVVRYLRRQKDIPDRDKARIFCDYRKMLEDATTGEPEAAELWPPHLRAAHDGLASRIRTEKDQKSAEAFRRLKERYSALEWTDGELCIVVPGSNGELVQEGAVLHHCVGRYGEEHLSGRPIFFVRKYRTPMRSYFTLNENLQGMKPHRVQLHGYGNEFAHGKRLRIPDKVQKFVARWEKEVLAPWHAQQQAEKYKTNKKKGRSAA